MRPDGSKKSDSPLKRGKGWRMDKARHPVGYFLSIMAIIAFCLGPILWCFVISITPESQMLSNSRNLLPQNVIWDNYAQILDATTSQHQTVVIGLTNSIGLSALTLLIGMPLCVVTAYALSIYEFRGKKLFVDILLLTIVIPVFSTIIPIYNIFRNLNLLDSMFWTSIIYVTSILPLNTWIMMNYFKQLPRELWQAAALDGFSQAGTFFKVILPVSTPAIITCMLIMFLMAWKQYVIPVILLTGFDSRTLTMIMSEFMTRDSIQYGMISAVGIISIIPPALVAVVFRKSLIGNMTAGALK